MDLLVVIFKTPELLHKLRVALLHLLGKLLASLVENFTFSRSKFVHYSLFLPAVGWPCQVGDLLALLGLQACHPDPPSSGPS